MFAVAPLEPARLWLTLKADPQEYSELTERQGIIPAPYLARAKWIAIESPEALPASEVAALLRKSYELVLAKLPRTARESAFSGAAKKRPAARKNEKNRKRR